MVNVTTQIPEALNKALENHKKLTGITKSQLLRDLLINYLMEAGYLRRNVNEVDFDLEVVPLREVYAEDNHVT